MRPGRRAWTIDDDALLRRLAVRSATVDRMAELLERTPKAINTRLMRLGLSARIAKWSGGAWDRHRKKIAQRPT